MYKRQEVDNPDIRAVWRAQQLEILAKADPPDFDETIRTRVADESPRTLRTLLGLLVDEPPHPTALLTLSEQWLALEPDSPDALNTAAWMLLTVDVEERRQPAQAFEWVDRALELLDQATEEQAVQEATQMRPSFLDTRAEAHRQLGRLSDALEDQELAVQLGRETDGPQLDEMEARLQVLREAAAQR